MKNIKFKYIAERVLAIVGLIITFPIFIFISILIKLDDYGSIFFFQKRIGENEKIFEIWKFRSMAEDADSLLNRNGEVLNYRITRVGKYLRSSGLDELPQLINIIKGDMTIIGPRPVLPCHIKRFSDKQKRRFFMKPGITGLAQVKGRNMIKWSRRIKYDVWYINNYSLNLDFYILLKTIVVIFTRKGFVIDRNSNNVDDLPFVD